VGSLATALPADGAISVLAFRLDPADKVVAHLESVLDDPERARAARFHFERHRRRFIVGRAVLRHLLAGALGSEPSMVRFSYGEHGKPALAGARALPFNLSNSSELAMIALGGDTPLGVDVERLRAMDDAEAIARRFFSATEVEAFKRLPAEDREAGFFRCWTRKEAYIKAIGDGLTMPLDRFDVAFGRSDPCRLLRVDGDRARAGQWLLAHLEPAAGYLGALARQGVDARLRGYRFDAARLARTV